jgi:hypothetical protein
MATVLLWVVTVVAVFFAWALQGYGADLSAKGERHAGAVHQIWALAVLAFAVLCARAA